MKNKPILQKSAPGLPWVRIQITCYSFSKSERRALDRGGIITKYGASFRLVPKENTCKTTN